MSTTQNSPTAPSAANLNRSYRTYRAYIRLSKYICAAIFVSFQTRDHAM
jgi:hypothetical protein